jgi:myo-inositol-1-phosphate synthase
MEEAWLLDACFNAYYASGGNLKYLKKLIDIALNTDARISGTTQTILRYYLKNPGKNQPKNFKRYVHKDKFIKIDNVIQRIKA